MSNLVELDQPRPHVRLLRLNRPEQLNPMSFDLVQALYDALDRVAVDNDCWVVVLTGAGRGFCSGLDLDDHGYPPDIAGLTRARAGMRAMTTMSHLVPAMRAIPQPIIAAINGPAYGGGMCLTLGAEIRIAAESAQFAAAAITNGLAGTELGISYLLPRAIGTTHAWELLLTGRRVDAAEAERIGLVSRVVPDGTVVDEALAIADGLCALSPFGISMTKRALWASLEASSLQAAVDFEDRNQLLAGYTGNLDEARAAFKERRKPIYRE